MSRAKLDSACRRAALAAWVAVCAAGSIPAAGPLAIERPDPGGRPLAVLANRDDDDRDGLVDADDERVNGPADERDLALLEVRVSDPRVVRLEVSSGDAPLRFFLRDDAGWRHAGLGRADVALAAGAGTVAIGVESRAWAGLPANWNGEAAIAITALDGSGASLDTERVACRVAPVLLRPATARATEVFVAAGRYDNEPFVAALRRALEPLGLPLAVHEAADWREMWMQDTMEIGTAGIAGSRMHVVLAGLRGADGFPPRLLGPDTAVARVAEPRGLSGGDAWADWYGNLEVSPPKDAHPAGRVIYGRNTRSNASFHPEVVRFLAAQGEQPPVWIDTSWLAIKHVDEIVAFLPGPDGRGVLVVPDPEEGLRLGGGQEAGAGVGSGAADLHETNRRIAAIIAAMLDGGDGVPRAGVGAESSAGGATSGPAPGLLALLGWERARVVRLPVAFRVPAEGLDAGGGVTGAAAAWSNPVNAVLLDGTVICGTCDMPEPVRAICESRFRAAGARAIVFIDDAAYHRRGGNVHCATNVRRE